MKNLYLSQVYEWLPSETLAHIMLEGEEKGYLYFIDNENREEYRTQLFTSIGGNPIVYEITRNDEFGCVDIKCRMR